MLSGMVWDPNQRADQFGVHFEPQGENLLKVTVMDNGVGLDFKEGQRVGHVSRGLQLVRKRLEYLSPHNRLTLGPKDPDDPSKGTVAEVILDLS